MTSIIIVFPKIEAAKGIKNVLVRNGYPATAVCTTGAQALGQADGLNDGIVICGYKMPDMIFTQLQEYLPPGFEVLLMASGGILEQCGGDVVSLALPLKVHDLISTVDMMIQMVERRRRRLRAGPRERSPEEAADIQRAKRLLMERNRMTEEEAHRYIQKCSMDGGNNLAETARMILSIMRE